MTALSHDLESAVRRQQLVVPRVHGDELRQIESAPERHNPLYGRSAADKRGSLGFELQPDASVDNLDFPASQKQFVQRYDFHQRRSRCHNPSSWFAGRPTFPRGNQTRHFGGLPIYITVRYRLHKLAPVVLRTVIYHCTHYKHASRYLIDLPKSLCRVFYVSPAGHAARTLRRPLLSVRANSPADRECSIGRLFYSHCRRRVSRALIRWGECGRSARFACRAAGNHRVARIAHQMQPSPRPVHTIDHGVMSTHSHIPRPRQ